MSKLQQYTKNAIVRIERITGYPLELITDTSLMTKSLAKIAPMRSSNKHVLRWNPDLVLDKFLDHIYLHEITHIDREWAAVQQGVYKVPHSSPEAIERAIEELEIELDRSGLAYELDPLLKKRLLHNSLDCFLTQLTSQPIDMRIESSIHQNYPNHRILQREYLFAEYQGLKEIGSREERRRKPPKLMKRNVAMNYAYLRCISEVLEDVTFRVLNMSREERSLGNHLYEVSTRICNSGHTSDALLIDLWAEIMEVRDWYEWRIL